AAVAPHKSRQRMYCLLTGPQELLETPLAQIHLRQLQMAMNEKRRIISLEKVCGSAHVILLGSSVITSLPSMLRLVIVHLSKTILFLLRRKTGHVKDVADMLGASRGVEPGLGQLRAAKNKFVRMAGRRLDRAI